MQVSQGNESLVQIKEVIFTPTTTTDTLKAGYGVCYNYDAVDDWDGFTKTENQFSKAEVTYIEGAQDFNARFLEVEKPSASNLHSFAGIVHPDSDGAGLGDKIKIFVPVNGVVPVYTDLDCVNGQTLFALVSASYTLTNPAYGGSTTPFRVVGVAAETISRVTTDGLCWARIGPEYGCEFTGCGVTANNLQVGSDAASGDLMIKCLSAETIQTGGSFSAYRIRGEVAGAGANAALGAAIRAEGVINANTVASGGIAACAVTSHLIFKTGCTPGAGIYAGLWAKVENQDGTPADLAAASICALWLSIQNNDAPTLSSQIYVDSDGSDDPDYFLVAKTASAITGVVSITNAPALATGDVMVKVKIVSGSGAGDWYIPLMADSGQ